MSEQFMTPQIMGFCVGLFIGVIDYFSLNFISQIMVRKGIESETPEAEIKKMSSLMRALGIFSFIAFPFIGYFAGPYVFGTGGA